MRRIGECPKCRKTKILGDHHPFPQRLTDAKKLKCFERLDILFPEWFPSGKNDDTIIPICFSCHGKLERYIPEEMLLPIFYLALLESYLNGGKLLKREVISKMVVASKPIIKKRRREKGFIVHSEIFEDIHSEKQRQKHCIFDS